MSTTTPAPSAPPARQLRRRKGSTNETKKKKMTKEKEEECDDTNSSSIGNDSQLLYGSSSSSSRSKTSNNKNNKRTSGQSNKARTQEETQRRRRMVLGGIVLVYLPLLAVFNPATLPKWISYVWKVPDAVPCDPEAPWCHDPVRLVFVRIPKTASTSLLELLQKHTYVFDMGELEDVLSSIPLKGVIDQPGYHDPQTRNSRLYQFYKAASHAILYAHQMRPRTLYQGHMHYFDFDTFAPRYYPNTTTTTTTSKLIPPLILDLYGRLYPQGPLSIAHFTMLRHPIERVASMYYYDRYEARQGPWRTEFVMKRGNHTLEECIQSDVCIQQNDFSRWCNLQTELLCGTDCPRGDVILVFFHLNCCHILV